MTHFSASRIACDETSHTTEPRGRGAVAEGDRTTAAIRAFASADGPAPNAALFAAAVECIGQALMLLEYKIGALTVVYVNPAFEAVTGYSGADILGRGYEVLLGPETESEEFQRTRDALLRGMTHVGHSTIHRKSGGTFLSRQTISPVRYGNTGRKLYTAAIEDISAPVAAAIARERGKSRARLESILDSAPDAILLVDHKQSITSFNRSAEILFGWRSAECRGKALSMLIPTRNRDRHADLAKRYAQDRNAEPLAMAGLRIVDAQRRDGTCIPVSVSLSRVEVEGQAQIMAIVHDMSELVIANGKLDRQAKMLAEQLEIARSANESKTRFLANMSHELRTPLNAIIGFSDMMRSPALDLPARRYKDYANDIFGSGQHLLSLISDVLDMARIEANEVDLKIESVSIRKVVFEAVRTIRPIARKKGIRFSFRVCRRLTACSADLRSLHQCLLNLLSNAVKFTPAAGHVRMAVHRQGNSCVFAVEDTGVGIPDDQLSELGKPFHRVSDNPHVRSVEGVGLGLSITKSLTAAMNGSFGVQSELGRGSTFRIAVPIVDAVGDVSGARGQTFGPPTRSSEADPTAEVGPEHGSHSQAIRAA